MFEKLGLSHRNPEKNGSFMYFLLENGGESYTWQRWKRGSFGTHIRTMPYVGSYPPPPHTHTHTRGLSIDKPALWCVPSIFRISRERNREEGRYRDRQTFIQTYIQTDRDGERYIQNTWTLKKGRHDNIPRQNRVCPVCSTASFETEHHFFLQCNTYNSVRHDFFPKLKMLGTCMKMSVTHSTQNTFHFHHLFNCKVVTVTKLLVK